jgi:hypothetical protein
VSVVLLLTRFNLTIAVEGELGCESGARSRVR